MELTSTEKTQKINLMRFVFLLILALIPLDSFCQSISEADIEKLADQVNQQIKGLDIGDGITARGCFSKGRTLIYQYNVPEYWEAPENIKEEVILNLKTTTAAKTYFLYNIDVEFYYYKGKTLTEKVRVKSKEFSTLNYELGEYLSTKDHPKAKEVNLKVKAPIGWEVKEGDRPNIVKKFVNGNNTYLILINENMTFFSRNESRELLQDDNFVKEFVNESSSFLNNLEVLDQSVMTLDTYPTVQYKVKGTMERSGVTIPMIMKFWFVFYEDKIVMFQAGGLDDVEFKSFEQLYTSITNSVIFPEQYN